MEIGLRESVNAFLEKQRGRGVKRNEIARTLFFKGYSERQVGLIMEISPKSAHAMKIRLGSSRTRKDLDVYFKGNIIREFNPFLRNVKMLVGLPVHSEDNR